MLDLLGLAPESHFEGRSLAPLLRADSPPPNAVTRTAPSPDVFLELMRQMKVGFDERVHERGLVRGSTKYLQTPKGGEEQYDLAADPGEFHSEPQVDAHTTQLRSALRTEMERLQLSGARAVPDAQIDEATKEKLRALGYKF